MDWHKLGLFAVTKDNKVLDWTLNNTPYSARAEFLRNCHNHGFSGRWGAAVEAGYAVQELALTGEVWQ